jgi:ketosteroid isomerase-like protein
LHPVSHLNLLVYTLSLITINLTVMRKRTFFQILAILLGLLFTMSCTQQPVDLSDIISKANDKFMEAFNSGDMNAVAQNYTEDGKLFPANAEIIEGKENIEAFWSGAPEMGVKKVKLETTIAEGFGNTAIEEGKYTLYTDGDVIIDAGKYIVTWEKVDGTWLMDRDIWNTSYPLPGGPNLQSGNMFGLHALNIKLKENVTSTEFEKFYLEEYVPTLEEHFPGIKLYLLKGERGENEGRYGEFIYFQSLDERNSWIPEPGNMSEKGEEAWSKFQPIQDKLNELIEWKTVYTDWLVL